ncbi:MAG: efflux RND transporter periplasmic adaptor subunit [Phycisphaerae bacterium]
MSTLSIAQRDATQQAASAAPVSLRDLTGTIIKLATQSYSLGAYWGEVLEVLSRAFASPYAAVSLRHGSEVIEQDQHQGATDTGFWKAAVQAYLTDSLTRPTSRAKLFHPRIGDAKVAFLAVPVPGGGSESCGVLAMVVARQGTADTALKLTALESLVCLASSIRIASDANRAAPGQTDPAAAGQALSRASGYREPEELAFAITNNLRNKLGCEQVALGMVHRRRVRVISISGLDNVAKQSNGVVCLRAAMEECLDRGEAIACQDEQAWKEEGLKTGHRLHKQWRAQAGGDNVASIPLQRDEKTVAVVSLRTRNNNAFGREQLEKIRNHVEPYAPALLLLGEARRGVLAHLRDTLADQIQSLARPGAKGRKIAAAMVGLLSTWMVFGTMNYELTVPGVVKPSQTRNITAPFEAVLATAAVVQGDRVQAGDVLCTLDHRELDQQQAELLAEIQVQERHKDQALARDDPVGFQLALAEQKLTKARLQIVNDRIVKCSVVAPIDGIVVNGDLRKRPGGVVMMGEPLFEIAPLDKWRLELAVPEADVDDLTVTLAGTFAARARPEQSQAFRIERIKPLAELRQGANVCVAEAAADLSAQWMRPGMEGIAKIEVGRRRVWWVLLHRSIDYLNLNLW